MAQQAVEEAVIAGRKVIYTDPHTKKKETGVITSFNPHYVFVRYGNDVHAKATKREHLHYV